MIRGHTGELVSQRQPLRLGKLATPLRRRDKLAVAFIPKILGVGLSRASEETAASLMEVPGAWLPPGWRIAEDPPVRFRRSAGMQPLPLPVQGGSIESLAPFLNLASMASRGAASGRPLSGPGRRRRTRISEDRPLEAPAGGGRSQRGAGAGPAAR